MQITPWLLVVNLGCEKENLAVESSSYSPATIYLKQSDFVLAGYMKLLPLVYLITSL